MKTKTILLVDDNPDDVQLTLRALKKNNILNEVVVAGTASGRWIIFSGQASSQAGT